MIKRECEILDNKVKYNEIVEDSGILDDKVKDNDDEVEHNESCVIVEDNPIFGDKV